MPRDDVGEPERFLDVREPWFELVNDGGRDADPFRGNNCLDCALSAIATWHGEPHVSAPRYAEYEPDGTPAQTGEMHGIDRARTWLGHGMERAGSGTDAFDVIADKLREGGTGSSVLIINEWPTGGAHAWNAFNRDGEIIWADPQRGVRGVEPIHKRVTGVWCIAIDREGRPL